MRISDWSSDVCSSDLSFRLIGVHRSLPMLCQKANSASIEAHEGLASQPLAIVGDDPISEVSTLLQYCKPRFNSLSVRCDIAGVDKQSDRCSDPCRLIAIHFPEHPAELAQGRKRHSNKRSEEHTSELQSLMRISYAVFC